MNHPARGEGHHRDPAEQAVARSLEGIAVRIVRLGKVGEPRAERP
jgi:hypothetical protein